MNALLQKIAALEAPPSEEEEMLSALPTAEEYAAAARARTLWFLLGGGLLAAAVAGAFVAFRFDNIFLPLALLIGVLTPILLWRFPRFILYFTLGAVCLIELGLMTAPDGVAYKDSLTDRIPLFWNINTIFQRYAHADFKAVPISLFELIIIVAGVCSCLRSVYSQTANLRAGAIFWPIWIYMAFVAMGWVNGMMTGGDFKVSLQETRSQFYFGLAYLMAVNIVRDRKQLTTMLWVTVLCVGLKGILLTFRRYVTLHGLPLPDQGVGAHEEAFFFDAFIALLLSLTVCGAFPKLRWTMYALLPFVLLGSLACNRRAGTAAFVIIVLLLILAAYQALPARRKLIAALAVVSLVAFAGYYSAFRHSNSIWAQPARAINSQFEPDARDASSNEYRDAENADLMATIHSAPIQGYGYGKHMIHAVPIADISALYEWWDIMTHNQVLWVWMRVGTFGFLAFWMMISAILIAAARIARDENADLEIKAVAIGGMLIVGSLTIFGLLDLQFSCLRDMLFAGIWTGVIAALPGFTQSSARPSWKGRRPL